jgi:succinate dehydrogenase / fumarate reductase flavoprotein subunit
MQQEAGIARTETDLERSLGELEKLKQQAQGVRVRGNREYNPDWHTALDLLPLLTVSEAIVRAALERKESRGAHYRDDYPQPDPAFSRVNIRVFKANDGSMQVSREPIPEMPNELKQIIESMK